MGLAHLLGLPGTVPAVAAVGPVVPLLTPADVVVHGDSLPPGTTSATWWASPGSPTYRRKRSMLIRRPPPRGPGPSPRPRPFVVHSDVDVLAFAESPLADVPEPVGLTLAEAMTSVAGLVRVRAAPACR